MNQQQEVKAKKGPEITRKKGTMDPLSREAFWGIGYIVAGVITALMLSSSTTLTAVHDPKALLPFVGTVLLWPFIALFHLSVLFGDSAKYEHKALLWLWIIPLGCAVLFFFLGKRRESFRKEKRKV